MGMRISSEDKENNSFLVMSPSQRIVTSIWGIHDAAAELPGYPD